MSRISWRLIADSASVALDRLRLFRRASKSEASDSSRRVALLAWWLPPSINAGVYRPLSLMRYSVEAGWQVDAFHGPVPQNQIAGGNELLVGIPGSVRRHVVATSSREPSWRLFPRIDGGYIRAIDAAQTCIRTLRERPPRVVLASGPPFCMFVAAFLVARYFGARLVLDYRDEWTECPFDFVEVGPGSRAWERRCLRTADAVVFTTESHRTHQLGAFPELSPDRAYLVPNGWEATDFGTAPGIEASGERATTITIAHIGSLAEHTPPEAFLSSVAQLMKETPAWRQRMRIQFVGNRSSNADAILKASPLADRLDVVDHVGKREANARMQSAGVLLLIAAPELERYLPGKLFDYIAARRPILVYGAPGEASKLVERLGVGRLCSPDTGGRGLAKALEELQSLDLRETHSRTEAWLQAHRRDVLAKEMFRILDGLEAGVHP